MKKMFAFLTLLVALASFVGAKDFLDDVGSAFSRGANRLFDGMPTPLKGEEYDKAFKEYWEWATASDDFKKHNFKKAGEARLSYCKKGLPEACGEYGGDFAVGLYTKRDLGDAKKYLQYAIKNTKYEGLRELYMLTLDIANELAKYSGSEVINTIKGKFSTYSSDCLNKRGAKDVCAVATVYSSLIPDDMLGLEDQDSALVELFSLDIERNGEEGSKLLKFVADGLTIQKVNEEFSAVRRDDAKDVVIDSVYGLMWQDGADIFGGDWDEVKRYCENLNFAGHSDWRLPTRLELLSITDDSRYNPAINKAFKYAKNSWYWSSTRSADGSSKAWFVTFRNGGDGWDDRSSRYFVRCVRQY